MEVEIVSNAMDFVMAVLDWAVLSALLVWEAIFYMGILVSQNALLIIIALKARKCALPVWLLAIFVLDRQQTIVFLVLWDGFY